MEKLKHLFYLRHILTTALESFAVYKTKMLAAILIEQYMCLYLVENMNYLCIVMTKLISKIV